MPIYQKKLEKLSEQTQVRNITHPGLMETRSAIPNSSMSSMLRIANGENNGVFQENYISVEERMRSLRESMFSRMSGVPIRPQAQIPRAEEEADDQVDFVFGNICLALEEMARHLEEALDITA